MKGFINQTLIIIAITFALNFDLQAQSALDQVSSNNAANTSGTTESTTGMSTVGSTTQVEEIENRGVDTQSQFQLYRPSVHQGYYDALSSQFNLDLGIQAIETQGVLFHMSMVQTEPALAAGYNYANQYVNQLADRGQYAFQMVRSAAMDPDDFDGKLFLNLFYKCLAQHTEQESRATEDLYSSCAGGQKSIESGQVDWNLRGLSPGQLEYLNFLENRN